MGTIKFTLRTDKKLVKTGMCPVELQYQISGQRKYFNTGKKLFEDNWKPEDQKAVFRRKGKMLESEVNAVNDKLAELSANIRKIERRLEDDNPLYSPDAVINELKQVVRPDKAKRNANNVFEFIDQYINEHQTTRVKGSLSVYKSLRTHLSGFDRKITFDKIDYHFFQRFQSYLLSLTVKTSDGKTIPRLNNTTIAKQLSTFKTFLNFAKLRGIKVSDKFKEFKIKRENLEVIALTNKEFETLFKLDLSKNKRLAHTRDIFCFSCATGLRYSDMAQLKREHIKGDEIRIVVRKTKEHLTVPLNPYSLAILNKYKEQHRPLPIISNQKLNDYIKELCELAGINEPVEIVRFRGAKRDAETYPKCELISVHTGRKTFCTLSLERGMSAEEVMTITGHKDYKSFKRYVKITEQRKRVVMRNAWGEIKMPKLKVV